MAETYLLKQFSLLKAKKSSNSEVATVLKSVNLKVMQKFLDRPKPHEAKVSLTKFIEKYLLKLNAADVDLNLRRAKLKEAKRVKKELEGKLTHLTESIENLNSIDEFTVKQRLNLQNREIRHEYFEEEKQKTQKVKKKAALYSKDYKKRQEKLQNHLNEINKEIEQERLLKQEQILKQQKAKSKEYHETLKKMHEKAEMRKKDMIGQKSYDLTLKKVKSEKPLFVKISEKYFTEIEMPELAKRKEELSKKRMLQSISSTQILEHAKNYDTLRHDNLRKIEKNLHSSSIDRKMNSADSTFTIWQQKILEEEKRQKAEQQKAFEAKLKINEKRTNYSNLVKQIYLPSIDPTKQQELEKRKQQLAKSTKAIRNEPRESSGEKAEWKPHSFKPNPLVPKKAERKIGKSVDYLGTLRQIRENKEPEGKEEGEEEGEFQWDVDLGGLNENERLKKLRQQNKRFEKEIKKKEIAMNNFEGTAKSLKYSEDINDMLINSIKGKIAILEKGKE